MNTVTQTEYHQNCPSCGAPGEGKEICPYCGSSLIKHRTVVETDTNIEDIISQKDASLPRIEGKLCGDNKFLKIFCSLFGGIFIAVPTVLFIIFLSVGLMEPWLIGFFAVFWVIGLGSLVPLFVSVSRKNKCKNGRKVIGLVRGYEPGNYMVNDSVVQIIRMRINENGTEKLLWLHTSSPRKPYPIGSKVTMRNNQNLYLIES